MLLVILFLDVMDLGFTGVCIATSLMFVVRFLISIFSIERIDVLKNTYGVKLFSEESRV